MKFVADDGTIFNSYDECEDYEKNCGIARTIADQWARYVTTFDKRGMVTQPETEIENAVHYLDEVSYICGSDDATYIIIAPQITNWSTITEYLREEYGTLLPSTPGIWRYDYSAHEWKLYAIEKSIFETNWAPLQHSLK